MQKRLMQRHDTTFGVVLYHKETPIVACYTKNICSTGMFINSGPVVYPEKSQLKIGFSAIFNGVSKRYKLPINIVHTNNNGLGLKFCHMVKEEDIFTHAVLGYVSRNQEEQNCPAHVMVSI